MEQKPKVLVEQFVFPGLALLVGVSLLFLSSPFWWFGVGLITASLGLLYKLLPSVSSFLPKPEDYQGLLNFSLSAFCLALIGVAVIVMIPEILTGFRPVNHDHTVHYMKAWRLQSFLSHGQLWGWSHQWFAGYPAQYLYPIGADLWVVMIRWASLGILNMGQAYAVGFALHWLLLGYALFACARQSFARTVSVLAAILFVTDIGDYRMGGWVFSGKWGVWPMNLSLAFGLLAVSRLKRILFGAQWRDVAIFGIWIGLGLLTHPIQLIHLGVIVPVALAARWFAQDSTRWIVATGRLLLGSGIGLAIGGLWLFPFLLHKGYSQAYGAPWRDAFRTGVGIYNLDLIPGTWIVVTAMGVLGLLGMLFSRKFYPLFFALISFVLLLTSTSTFVDSFHLSALSKSFQNIQFQRFAVILKPYVFIAAAYVIVQTIAHLATLFHSQSNPSDETDPKDSPSPYWTTFVRLALVGFLLAPLLYPFLTQYIQRHTQHLYNKGEKESLQTVKNDEFLQSKKAFVVWAKKEFPKVKSFFRLALLVGNHDHRFFDLERQLHVPLYKTGFTPATIYRYKMEAHTPKMLRAVNVLFVLSKWHLSSKDFDLIQQFGKLYVYKLKRWNPNPFEIVEGKGTVKLQSFKSEEILLKAEPGSKGMLRLNVSYFPRWKVTHNGSPLTIRPTKVNNDSKTGFMTVVLKPGQYRFTFRKGFVEYLSALLFVLGFAFCLMLSWVDAKRSWMTWLSTRLQQWSDKINRFETSYAKPIRHAVVLMLLAGLGFSLALAIWKPHRAYRHPYLHGKIHKLEVDFRDQFQAAKATTGQGSQLFSCAYIQDRFHCGSAEWQHIRVQQVQLDEDRWQRCIWMHPQPNGPVTLNFPTIKVGNLITGYIAVAKTGHMDYPSPVKFQLLINGKSMHQSQTHKDGVRYHYHVKVPPELHGKPVNVSFRVQARRTGRRHFCFLAQGIQLLNP